MNQEEFETKIMEIRNRALSKALTLEEEITTIRKTTDTISLSTSLNIVVFQMDL